MDTKNRIGVSKFTKNYKTPEFISHTCSCDRELNFTKDKFSFFCSSDLKIRIAIKNSIGNFHSSGIPPAKNNIFGRSIDDCYELLECQMPAFRSTMPELCAILPTLPIQILKSWMHLKIFNFKNNEC